MKDNIAVIMYRDFTAGVVLKAIGRWTKMQLLISVRPVTGVKSTGSLQSIPGTIFNIVCIELQGQPYNPI
jgi:hypothetical protein